MERPWLALVAGASHTGMLLAMPWDWLVSSCMSVPAAWLRRGLHSRPQAPPCHQLPLLVPSWDATGCDAASFWSVVPAEHGQGTALWDALLGLMLGETLRCLHWALPSLGIASTSHP